MTDLSNRVFPHPQEPTPTITTGLPDLVTLDSFRVGELDEEKRIEIVESIINLTVTLSANAVSSINFTVYDPSFRMHDNNYFLIKRIVEFNDMLYEISNIKLNHKERDTVQVTARNMKMQKMRRDIGPTSWRLSPTGVARHAARKFGLGFVAESSAFKGVISRTYDEKNKESTYDVLKRLARELEFMFFEAKDYLFFASQDFIVDLQEQIRVYVPGRDNIIDPVTGGNVTDIIFPLSAGLSKDDDDKKPATFNVNAYTNPTTQQLYPGLGASFWKVRERYKDNQLVTAYEEPFPNFETLFMIDKVSYTVTPNQATTFSGTALDGPADMFCSAKPYTTGDTGVCVERIQHAVGLRDDQITGVFDSLTKEAVINFQKANIIQYSDSPQFSGDNWKEYITLGVVGRVTWEWIKALSLSQITVPLPPLRAQDADDAIRTRGFTE